MAMSTCSIVRVGGARTKVKGALLLDVVVRKSAAILELLAGEDEALLIGRDALLILNFRLHSLNAVRRLNLKGDRLACEGLDEDLHTTTETEHYGMISATVKRYVCEPQLTKVKGRLLLDIVIR